MKTSLGIYLKESKDFLRKNLELLQEPLNITSSKDSFGNFIRNCLRNLSQDSLRNTTRDFSRNWKLTFRKSPKNSLSNLSRDASRKSFRDLFVFFLLTIFQKFITDSLRKPPRIQF